MTEEQLTEQKHQMHAGKIVNLVGIGKDYQLTTVDSRKVDDSETVGVKVSKQGERDVTLYFDKKSKLLRLAVYNVKAAELDFKEVPLEVYHDDYKEIEGGQVATKMKIRQDGKLFIEAKLSDVKPVKKFAEDTFAKPE